MLAFYDRYQKGAYQEVYDELFVMQDRMYDPGIYKEAIMVMREIMHRIRFNLELIVEASPETGISISQGRFLETFSAEEKAHLDRNYPILQPSTQEAIETLALLEQRAGTFPLSLKCWYEEVGCANLIGLFSTNERAYGPFWILCISNPLKYSAT